MPASKSRRVYDPEKRSEYGKRYRAKETEYARRWRAANREHLSAYQRARRLNRPPKPPKPPPAAKQAPKYRGNRAPDPDLPGEVWLPVVGYEGWYEVSSCGRVRRARRGQNTRPGRVLHYENVKGYARVALCRQSKVRRFTVHRLVLMAHVGPPPTAEHQGNHIDATPLNNASSNLEWVTCRENLALRRPRRQP